MKQKRKRFMAGFVLVAAAVGFAVLFWKKRIVARQRLSPDLHFPGCGLG